MAYTKTTWVADDGSGTVGTRFTAGRMNNIEQGIADAHASIAAVPAAGSLQYIGDLTDGGAGTPNQLGISNIPQTFRALRLIGMLQSTHTGWDNAGIRFNGANTAYHWLYKGEGQATMAAAATDLSGAANAQPYGLLGSCPGTERVNDSYVGVHIVDIPYYALTNTIKIAMAESAAHDGNSAYAQSSKVIWYGGTAAITSLSYLTATAAYAPARSKASLYGIV
jgi:hypothetical protein